MRYCLKKTPPQRGFPKAAASAFLLFVAQTERERRLSRRDVADALAEEPVEEKLLVDRPRGERDAVFVQRFDKAARDEHLIHVDGRDAS